MATTSNTYTGNGSNKLFSITFPYLETTDVDVYLNGTLQTITTQYTFANATTIEFVAAPANGAVVLLDRSTDDATLQATFFPGSSIKAADLNLDFDQVLYIAQETSNEATTATSTAATATTTANTALSQSAAAVSTANTASSNASAAVSTANTASTNASNAVTTANTASSNATTAVNTANAATSTANSAASDASTALSTANTALTNANSAVTTANTASSNATAAVSTANTASTNASNAVTTANGAVTTANTADTNSNTAITTANAAVSTANSANTTAGTANTNAANAVTTANTASTNASAAVTTANSANTTSTAANSTAATALSTANTALSTANTALSTANTASTNASSAVTTANSADSKADQAIAAVASSINYTLVANVAGIPSSPTNGLYIEVGNSTGLESFTPLAGLPSGFVGDSGLTVRLVYQTSNTSWNWLTYFANNSETRYLKLAGGTLTGALAHPLGAAATPSITFTGDPNTGIYSPGADQVAVATNGSERLRITSAGLVGVGTSVPNSVLHIEAPEGTAQLTIGNTALAASDGDFLAGIDFHIKDNNDATGAVCTSIRSIADQNHTLTAKGTALAFSTTPDDTTTLTERLRIDQAGRVGIGSTTVDNKLQVVGDVGIGDIGTSGTYDLYWAPNTAGGSVRWFRSEGSAFGLGIGTTAGISEHLKVDGSGRLLVGTSTTSQDSLLVVEGSSSSGTGASIARFCRGEAQPTTNQSLAFLIFGNNAHSPGAWINAAADGNWSTSTPSYPTRLVFSTTANGAASPTERLRITSSGNVGIGNTVPSSFNPDLNTLVVGSGSGSQGIMIYAGTASTANLTFHDTVNASLSGMIRYDHSSNAMSFWTNGVNERARIDSSGRVGIGTTSPSTPLHVSIPSASDVFRLNRSDANGYFTVNFSSQNTNFNSYQQYIFSQQGTERARIDSSGRLLIGTSTARSNLYNNSSGVAPQVQLEGTSFVTSSMMLVRNSADVNDTSIILGKTRGTSTGASTIVSSGDGVGAISFQGADGSELVEAASIQAVIDGTPGANDMPGRLFFLRPQTARLVRRSDSEFQALAPSHPSSQEVQRFTRVWLVALG
jgi:hypothetical protein